ncbi:hypothetical protein GCK32_020883, partial [Trichostrongylus colubriformis]
DSSVDFERFDQFARALFSDGRVQLTTPETNNHYEQDGSLRSDFCATLDNCVL